MTVFDWILFVAMLTGLLGIGWWCKRHMHSVADFLVVGRSMRKYLGLSTGTAEGIGLVSIAFVAEQGFRQGFAYVWMMLIAPASVKSSTVLPTIFVLLQSPQLIPMAALAPSK